MCFFTGNKYFWLGIIDMSLFWETNPEPSSMKSSISNQFLACWETTCCINLLLHCYQTSVGLPNWNTVAKRRLRSCSAGRILAIHWPVEQFQWFFVSQFLILSGHFLPGLLHFSSFWVSTFWWIQFWSFLIQKKTCHFFFGFSGSPKDLDTHLGTWKPLGGMICASFWKDSC